MLENQDFGVSRVLEALRNPNVRQVIRLASHGPLPASEFARLYQGATQTKARTLLLDVGAVTLVSDGRTRAYALRHPLWHVALECGDLAPAPKNIWTTLSATEAFHILFSCLRAPVRPAPIGVSDGTQRTTISALRGADLLVEGGYRVMHRRWVERMLAILLVLAVDLQTTIAERNRESARENWRDLLAIVSLEVAASAQLPGAGSGPAVDESRRVGDLLAAMQNYVPRTAVLSPLRDTRTRGRDNEAFVRAMLEHLCDLSDVHTLDDAP